MLMNRQENLYYNSHMYSSKILSFFLVLVITLSIFVYEDISALEDQSWNWCCLPSQPIKKIIFALKEGPWSARRDAAWALGELGSDGQEGVPYLINTLNDSNSAVRNYSAEALGKIGKEAKPAIPQLIVACSDPMYTVRANAAAALGMIGLVEPGVVDALIKAVNDSEESVRHSAGAALGKLNDPEARKAFTVYKKVAIPELMNELDRRNIWSQGHAAAALGEIGPDASVAVKKLIPILSTSNSEVKVNVASALQKIGTPEAIDAALPALLELLEAERTYWIRAKTIKSLRAIGTPEALSAIERFEQSGRNN
jgi:HEAT repeat protein